jgi:hypothetical protein
MNVVKSYSLYLNTREADYGTSNNCTFVFTTPFVLTNVNNRFRVSTPMIELPYSFSQLNLNNNKLPYSWYTATHGNFTSSITFDEGNYNITQLLSAFVSLIVKDINLNVVLVPILASSNISATYSATTGTTSFFITGLAFQATIALNFANPVGYVLGIMLGFNQNTIKAFGSYTGGPVVPSLILESPNKVMVNPITSVYIRSETLKFESNYEAIVTNVAGSKSNFQNSDVLSKIPVTVLPNAIIYFRTKESSIITNKELSELNLYISDNLSPTYSLDMQGLNYGIMVLFEEITFPQLNQYKDKLEYTVEMPRKLLEERSQLIDDLKKQKEQLELEIKQQKENEKE